MAEEVADCGRGDMGVLLGCRDDYSLDFRSELAVGVGDGAFRLKVYHVADSPDDVVDTEFAALVYGQAVILDDADSFKTCCGLSDDGYPFFIGEEAAFADVHADSYDDFVEHCQCAFQNIQMARCEGVEGSGE